MKPKHAVVERYRRAEEAYLQRVQSRVEEEEAGGTVFLPARWRPIRRS